MASGSLAQLAATYRTIANGLTNGADELGRLPAPSFPGGVEFARHGVAGQQAIAKVFSDVSTRITGAPSSEAAQKAIAGLQPALLSAAQSMLRSFGSMPIAATDGFNRTPDCGGLPFRF